MPAETLLDETPHATLLHGVRSRLGVLRRVHVWGLELEVPRGLLTPHERWLLRHGELERPEAAAVLALLDPSLPLIEIGGGMGLVACHANRLLKDPSRHVVVEMDRRLLPYLERNRAANRCAYHVRHAAFSYAGPTARFRPSRTTYQGQTLLEGDATETVPTVTLRHLVEETPEGRAWPRYNLLMDVEGMEAHLLAHEADLLRAGAATLIVEVHPDRIGPDGAAAFLNDVARLGYGLRYVSGTVYGFVRETA